LNKLILTLSVACIALILTDCKTSKSTTAPADTELAAAQKRWPDATTQSLQAGRTIYNEQCTRCHGAKPISQYSEQEWERIIGRMAPKAKLTADQTETLRRYILTSHDLSAK
jgi:cytochrome c5